MRGAMPHDLRKQMQSLMKGPGLTSSNLRYQKHHNAQHIKPAGNLQTQKIASWLGRLPSHMSGLQYVDQVVIASL